jgi:hypothetical protein
MTYTSVYNKVYKDVYTNRPVAAFSLGDVWRILNFEWASAYLHARLKIPMLNYVEESVDIRSGGEGGASGQ